MNEETDKIIEMLDKLAVPGQGDLSWDRILLFAKEYQSYEQVVEKKTVDKYNNLDVLFLKPIEDLNLSQDQERAWNKLKVWAINKEPYFTLRGSAGTGKSFLLKMLTSLNLAIYFTAPTNKATKVLSKFVGQEAKTTFSQLGLRMSQDDEKLVLEYGANIPYMPRNSILVVDEASMVSKELGDFIEETRKKSGCKVLYVGDPVQLPPVGENYSRSWKRVTDKQNTATLKKVMRYDNQLLKIATRIRDQIIDKDFSSYPMEDDNDGDEGVFLLHSKKSLIKELHKFNKPEDFLERKVIAWRNKTVNEYNEIIREHLGFKNEYDIGDIVLIAEPVEINDVIVANIDDEFTIIDIIETEIKTSSDIYVPVYKIQLKNEDTSLSINVVKDKEVLDTILNKKAAWAKECKGVTRKQAWKDFWDTKKLFCSVRYSYSITAHRSQGSTYEAVFIDQQDILSNKNKKEAWRCLYVSCTRASQILYTF